MGQAGGQARGQASYLWLRRLHSFLGFFPFSIFLIQHFTFNSFILQSPQAFDNLVKTTQEFPLTIFLEIGLLLIPISFHILLGIVILYTGSANVVAYNTYRNWMYLMQRVTGFIVLPFLIYHVWMTRMQAVFTGHHVDSSYMHHYFASDWVKGFYALGIVAACFHMANGIATMLITWGITQTQRSQDIASLLSWILFLGMSAWGVLLIFAF